MIADRRSKRSRRENPIVYLDVKIGEQPAGRLVIELRADVVPKTADNFHRLCTGETKSPYTGKRRQYTHCLFHRVVKDKFCQSGDYTNHDGSGGESTYDAYDDAVLDVTNQQGDTKFPSLPTTAFADENFILRHTGRGVLSMANAGPDTNTSQFYIHFAPSPLFDDQHVVFGCLVGADSFQVLGKIQEVATERGDPKLPVKITGCGQFDTTITTS